TPTTTPTEVMTSVSRCLPSALSVGERCRIPARTSRAPTTPLRTAATTEIAMPSPGDSSGAGLVSRATPGERMTAAARKIIAPSTTAEKYAAVECPYWGSASAGRAATVSAMRATTAATRLTTDSAASDSRPTDPVIHQAHVLRPMVTTAVATESHANFRRVDTSDEDSRRRPHAGSP